ncbi:MAG: prephenate dehydrogenase [Clostridiales bacterium]|nr:prephenate dehydrogenase [Clostridiales bacterium]
MIFGIAGLGLIGGSMAKTIKSKLGATVFGFDKNEDVLKTAIDEKIIDETLTSKNIGKCDVLLIALYPTVTVDFVTKNHKDIKSGAFVFDLCGIKTAIMDSLEKTAKHSDFIFIGGHPMSGTENSGYAYSTSTLFDNASMILTPYDWTPEQAINKAKSLFLSLGFGNVKVTTAKEHDKVIAFTSQLAHIVSNAYVKSPTALLHRGFSAGSYKDLTRVAKLNEQMWTELFLDNKEPLIEEIDCICQQLTLYKNALKQNDKETLKELLKHGREIKEQVDTL